MDLACQVSKLKLLSFLHLEPVFAFLKIKIARWLQDFLENFNGKRVKILVADMELLD